MQWAELQLHATLVQTTPTQYLNHTIVGISTPALALDHFLRVLLDHLLDL
jgi:hypothetical protein